MHRRRRSECLTWSTLGFARIFHCEYHTLPTTYSGVASKTSLPWYCRQSSQFYPWDEKDPYGTCQEKHGMLLIAMIINIGETQFFFLERRHRCILVGFRFFGEEEHCRCFWEGGKGYRKHRVHCLRRWALFSCKMKLELTWNQLLRIRRVDRELTIRHLEFTSNSLFFFTDNISRWVIFLLYG